MKSNSRPPANRFASAPLIALRWSITAGLAAGSLISGTALAEDEQTAKGQAQLPAIRVEDRFEAETFVPRSSTSATKTGTALSETPQAVSVVSREQMDAQGVRLMTEALRYTPGVFSEANGNDIRYNWTWVRGFDAYATSWLDGLAMTGDSINYATPVVHPYALERVEVIKGPASVLYGRSLPGGLINQVSKRPQAVAAHEIWAGTNNFGGIEGGLDSTGALSEDGQWLYRVVGYGSDLDTQIDQERNRSQMLAPSLTWLPDEDTSLTLSAYYQRDRDVFSPRFYPAYGTLLPNPTGDISRDLFMGEPDDGQFNREYWSLGYEFSHRFNDTWSVRQNLRYGQAEQDMLLVLVNPAFAFGFGAPPSNNLSRVSAISDDRLTSLAVDNQLEARFATGAVSHQVLIGLDYSRTVSETLFGNSGQSDVLPPPLDFLNPIYGSGTPIPSVQREGRQTLRQTGIYLQDQLRLDRWIATLGARYDRAEVETDDRLNASVPTTNSRDSEWSVRTGLSYAFDNGISPYASYTTSFLPTLGTDRSGNTFKAQTAEQYEVGAKYQPKSVDGSLALSLFRMTVDNALTPDPVNINTRVQSGKQRVQGVEIEALYAFNPQWRMLASYAYSDSEVLESNNANEKGREMQRLPEHQSSLWLQYRPGFAPELALSAGVRALSSYQSDSTYRDDLRIPSRELVDLGAEYHLVGLAKELEGLRLQLNASNIFDERHVSHCLNITGGSCNYGPARTVRATVSYAW